MNPPLSLYYGSLHGGKNAQSIIPLPIKSMAEF
ncbi:hypothetical protein S-MbCM7_209 [Synechococcus phage ACG-2014h]|uniref:Uncharacterized protein n=1 Tax=Synechococcus phage ACG-2014h TaxID=1340810 RepID=V5USI3_9CAUD|nr:hypothetical protein S-MbCM7_209 [Synechococcus phage ACG-2014h]AHB80623.1 hypothetical protein S-MbCM7_209 [Synechococcus phage ACG-2014h]